MVTYYLDPLLIDRYHQVYYILTSGWQTGTTMFTILVTDKYYQAIIPRFEKLCVCWGWEWEGRGYWFTSICLSKVPRPIFVKDFSRTIVARILRFATQLWYNLLYCGKQFPVSCSYLFLCPFFYLSKEIFHHRFLSNSKAKSLQTQYAGFISLDCKPGS